jgi:hypothetical protein
MPEKTPPLRIDLWYGKKQSFGQLGRPQRWLNILGRVIGEHAPIRLTYQLDSAPVQPLSLGPDMRRLAGRGDFNLELDWQALSPGIHRVVLFAVDAQGNTAHETVEVGCESERPWPLPYSIDWQRTPDLQSAAQVVDGKWEITPTGVAPVEIGYDRLLAIGDNHWKSVEIQLPVTVHGFNSGCYRPTSVHAGVGVVMHFKGHMSWPSDGSASGQPRFGYLPFGAIGWYTLWHDAGGVLNFFDTECSRVVQQSGWLRLNRPYIFKIRVESKPSQPSLYSLKVWPVGEDEPAAWNLQTPGSIMSLDEGALFLVAHETAATFGNLSITPLE